MTILKVLRHHGHLELLKQMFATSNHFISQEKSKIFKNGIAASNKTIKLFVTFAVATAVVGYVATYIIL